MPCSGAAGSGMRWPQPLGPQGQHPNVSRLQSAGGEGMQVNKALHTCTCWYAYAY